MQERHGRENLTPTGEGEPRPPLRRSVNKETTRDGEEGGTPADAPQLDTRNSELGKKEKRKNGEKEAKRPPAGDAQLITRTHEERRKRSKCGGTKEGAGPLMECRNATED